jgi:hypothetical protein
MLLALASAVFLGSGSFVSDLRFHFSSPPTTRRVTVEVFDPASTRVALLSRAEQSSSLLPATSQYGHSWHRAPLGPMAVYLFSVKTFVFFSSFVVPPLIKSEELDIFITGVPLLHLSSAD